MSVAVTVTPIPAWQADRRYHDLFSPPETVALRARVRQTAAVARTIFGKEITG